MSKRRDFLAGLSTAPLLPLWAARAAYAQNAPAAPPADKSIARLAIYPPLGISRVGNSPEWFAAPEVPGLPPLADGRYKDDQHRIKKQVQRFRIYAFNQAGEVIREITASEARIDWTVHVANTKAAWYDFNNPFDLGEEAPGLPSKRRNDGIQGAAERAAMLAINPGPKKIGGANVNAKGDDPAYAMAGKFWRRLDVTLGHLQTDSDGRLLVVPGDGQSHSAFANNGISNFSDNDGWQDNWCDGVVQAEVRIGAGPTMTADNAWVVCCAPDFAPDLQPIITLYDVMTDVAIDAGWAAAAKAPLSFRKHLYPFFRRLAQMEWVTSSQNLSTGWLGANFSDPAFAAKLADPGSANRPFRAQVLGLFRDPNSSDTQQFKLPYMMGDGINYAKSPVRWARIPKRQYALLQMWADGAFTDDLGKATAESETVTFDRIPLAEQPEALTRAALEACSGAAMHPGIEVTWPMRHRELYRGPYRVALATDRDASLIQDFGPLLTPEKALGSSGVLGPQLPGDLTRWMGLPWQCDVYGCEQVNFDNDFPLAAWWPSQVPGDVLPEAYYRVVMDATQPAEQRRKFFESRVSWLRGVTGVSFHPGGYSDGIARMVSLWERMGFIVRRPGPTDADKPPGIPPVLYVEVDRGSMDFSGGAVPETPRPPPNRRR